MRFQSAILPAIVLLLCAPGARADGILMSWSPQDIEGMTQLRANNAKLLDTAKVLERIRKPHDWASVYEAALATRSHASEKPWLAMVAGELDDAAEAPLEGTSRLILWEHIRSGDIVFEGEGYQVDDDLYRAAGRANWILRTTLKKNFGTVRHDSSQEELDSLRKKWETYLAGKPVPEQPILYPSESEGLSELRSPVAIQALIRSLHPNPEKTRVTTACLKKTYGLDQMPTAPDAPEQFCNPDAFTNQYLASITDVPDPHPAEWWDAWWVKEGGSLRWDAEGAKFRSGGP